MEADQQDNSKVLSFRPRMLTGSRDRKDNNTGPDEDICRPFDLSRYELRERPDNFRKRMIANGRSVGIG